MSRRDIDFANYSAVCTLRAALVELVYAKRAQGAVSTALAIERAARAAAASILLVLKMPRLEDKGAAVAVDMVCSA